MATATTIAKGTEGFILYRATGEKLHSEIVKVRVKQVRREGGQVLTTMGTRLIGAFYLTIDDAAEALERCLCTEREEALARMSAIADTLAKLDEGVVPYTDMCGWS